MKVSSVSRRGRNVDTGRKKKEEETYTRTRIRKSKV